MCWLMAILAELQVFSGPSTKWLVDIPIYCNNKSIKMFFDLEAQLGQKTS